MSRNRLPRLIAAAADAQMELQKHRDGLLEVHVPMSLPPKTRNVPEREVRAEVRRLDRLIERLRGALTCEHCGAISGKHYGNCPAAMPATTIKGPGE